jgi:hypothetical protein
MVTSIILVILALFILLLISSLWAEGIDYMNTHHKDYRGEDFLDEKLKPKN